MTKFMIILFVVLTTVFLSVGVGLIQSFSDLKYEVKRKCSYQADASTVSYAKCDIIDHIRALDHKIDSNHEELLTEIACLATKNNADIQRVREGYKPGDVIEYDGEQYVVLIRKNVVDELNRITDFYRLCRMKDGDVYTINRDDVDKNSKFLRHVDLLLEEPVL